MKDNEKIEPHVLQKYQIVKKLGSGAYGHVWKAKVKATGATVALKKIFDAFQHSTDAQRTFREICVLKQLKHDKVIELIQVIPAHNNQDIYLVFGFMESDLYHMVYDGKLQPVHVKYLMYQIALGLHYLHECKLIHRDLKPSNILINSDCSVKICDFGLVRYLQNQIIQANTLTEGVATRWYRAPEVLLGSNSYDTKADMWSLGCILAEILIKSPLFPGNCTTNQLQRILQFTGQPSAADIKSLQSELGQVMISQVAALKQKKTDYFNKIKDQDAINLVYQLLQFNPEKRIDAAQALKHPYFADFYDPKDLAVKRTPILMEVNQNIRLESHQYLEIIKEKFVTATKKTEITPKSRSKRQISESPKSFTELRKSRLTSTPGGPPKEQKQPSKQSSVQVKKKNQKSTNLFKELCKAKSSSKEKDQRKKAGDSLNKENQAGNLKPKPEQSFSSFAVYAKTGNGTGLRKTGKVTRG